MYAYSIAIRKDKPLAEISVQLNEILGMGRACQSSYWSPCRHLHEYHCVVIRLYCRWSAWSFLQLVEGSLLEVADAAILAIQRTRLIFVFVFQSVASGTSVDLTIQAPCLPAGAAPGQGGPIVRVLR